MPYKSSDGRDSGKLLSVYRSNREVLGQTVRVSQTISTPKVGVAVTIYAWGGGGASGTTGDGGGAGAAVIANMILSQNQTYNIVVGGGGTFIGNNQGIGPTVSGGGGNTGNRGRGSQGGGYSGIFVGIETTQNSAILIAAGGGGSGFDGGAGGAGGAGIGETGGVGIGVGGGGGTLTAGGSVGSAGTSGSALKGGDGRQDTPLICDVSIYGFCLANSPVGCVCAENITPYPGEGGGGGGYFGGGSGRGGGGGSSYVNTGVSTAFKLVSHTIYAGVGTLPGNSSSSLRQFYGAGAVGVNSVGSPGVIKIVYPGTPLITGGISTVTANGYTTHTFTSNTTMVVSNLDFVGTL